MANSKTFGAVIGERRLTTRGTRPTPVTVTLGRPRLPRSSQDWECPFRITGGGLHVSESGYGVDAIQAIQTALQGIRYFLDQSGTSFDWLGTPDGGFQRSIPFFGDPRFTKRMEKLVDSELKKRVAILRRRHRQRAG